MTTLPAEDRVDEELGVVTDTDPRLQLVERICGSEAFKKSNRLPLLLRYLAQATINSERGGLTESAIGRAVLGKPADFTPTEDSSVRVHVRQLRLRLHEYFQSVGQGESLVIDIPKGAYALAFHSRTKDQANDSAINLPIETERLAEQLPQPVGKRSVWLPWVCFAFASAAAVGGWLRTPPASSSNPPWPVNAVIETSRPTTMVLADGSYNLRLLGNREIGLDEYADHRYSDSLIPQTATAGELRLFRYLKASQITSMADAHAVAAITSLAGSMSSAIIIRSAKEVTGSTFTSGNLILVGAKTSNPWQALYEDRLNFRLVDVNGTGVRYVLNRAPQPGEKSQYSVTGITGSSGEDYATLSLLPGPSDQGTVMLVQGLRLEGTEAAIRFLVSEKGRKQLGERLAVVNKGSRPKYFEALLHAHSVGGSAPTTDCVAVRVIREVKD